MPYTLRAAAKALGVSATTVARWVESKQLYELPVKGGVTLISDESVERLARERGITLRSEEAVS